MDEPATVRCRVVRGFRIGIGEDVVADEVVDLPRAMFQLMLGANAVEAAPNAVLGKTDHDKPSTKGGESKSKEKQS